ncbi:MAG: FHA domain-containing protein [Rhodoglobus sp.]
MAEKEGDGFLIAPPPGLIPEHDERVAASAEDFITMPPLVSDSATHKLASAKVAPEAKPAAAEITFFPTTMPPPTPAPTADETQLRPDRPATPAWRLVLGDGLVVPVESAVLVGRDPAHNAEFPTAGLLAIVEPEKTISKTHAVVEADAGELWVRDLNSTNGTYVVLPDGTEVDATADDRTEVPAGADLVFGEYVVQVERS